MIRLFWAMAISSSWRHTGDAAESGLKTKSRDDAPSIPRVMRASQSAPGGMSVRSTHTLLPRASSCWHSSSTKRWSVGRRA